MKKTLITLWIIAILMLPIVMSTKLTTQTITSDTKTETVYKSKLLEKYDTKLIKQSDIYMKSDSEIAINDGNSVIEFKLKGTTSKQTEFSKDVKFVEAIKDVDIIYNITQKQIKETLVVKKYKSNKFEYDITFTNIFGYGYYNNNLVLYDAPNNAIGQFVRPYVTDSNNTILYGEYELINNTLTVIFDDLTIRNMEYPIYIDPTYDDFNDGSINTGLWTVNVAGGGTATETATGGGYMTIASSGDSKTAIVDSTKSFGDTNSTITMTIAAGISADVSASVVGTYVSIYDGTTSVGLLLFQVQDLSVPSVTSSDYWQHCTNDVVCTADIRAYIDDDNELVTLYNADGTTNTTVDISALNGNTFRYRFRTVTGNPGTGSRYATINLQNFDYDRTDTYMDFYNLTPTNNTYIKENTQYYYNFSNGKGQIDCNVTVDGTYRHNFTNIGNGYQNFSVETGWIARTSNITVNCFDNGDSTAYTQTKQVNYGINITANLLDSITKTIINITNITVQIVGTNYQTQEIVDDGNANFLYYLDGTTNDTVSFRAYQTYGTDYSTIIRIIEINPASTQSYNLYLTNTSDTDANKLLTFTVFDQDRTRIQGALIHILKQDPATNTYLNIADLTTNPSGEASTRLQLDKVFYKILVDYNDERAYTQTESSAYTSNDLFIDIIIDTSLSYTALYDSQTNVPVNIDYTTVTNASGNFTVDYSGTSTKEICLYVDILNATNTTRTFTKCENGTSGTIESDTFAPTNITLYIAKVYVDQFDGYGSLYAKELAHYIGRPYADNLGKESLIFPILGIVVSAFGFMGGAVAGLVILIIVFTTIFLMKITLINAGTYTFIMAFIILAIYLNSKKSQ